MPDVTHFLARIKAGDNKAAGELFSLVYEELRRLARSQMSNERSDHTLQATALVNEAYLRLMGGSAQHWDGRGHFFVSAAEAMRRILIEHARAKQSLKRNGDRKRIALEMAEQHLDLRTDGLVDILALDEALEKLADESPAKAKLVKLRFFAGLSIEEAAKALEISETTAKRYWVSARAWLFKEMEQCE
jgi:RNA polymerase sigma factor (TIGR02999 family)